jgi:hypothetical protein
LLGVILKRPKSRNKLEREEGTSSAYDVGGVDTYSGVEAHM